MSSEEDNVIEEKNFIIETDKNNEMDLYLKNYNNEEIIISIYTKNEYPTRKFELKCDLEEIQKNRFFRIFTKIEEIMRELEDKIKKSTFIEENDFINIEIPIGLIIIENINLRVELIEKTTKEINDELKNKINEQNEEIKKLKNKINKDNMNLNNQINEKDEIIKKLREEIAQLKKNNEQIQNEKISNKNKLKVKL